MEEICVSGRDPCQSCNQSDHGWHKMTGRESRIHRSVWMYPVCVGRRGIYSHLCICKAWHRLCLSPQNSQEATITLGHGLSPLEHYSVMQSMFKTQYNMENYEGAHNHFSFLFFGTIDWCEGSEIIAEINCNKSCKEGLERNTVSQGS